MQSEIRFRALGQTDNTWHYGLFSFMTEETVHIVDDSHIWICQTETIGQYTGLKDKNGKEIYEGDIVRAEDGETFTVKYGEHNTSEWNDTYELGFYVESNSEEEISRAIRTDIIFWVKYRHLEVIGNIYDNPELLEVSE